MPAPKPSEFNALIPSGSSSVCQKLNLVLLRLPVLVAQAIAFLFKEDGTLTDEFKALIGAAATETGGAGLSAPSGLSATDGSNTNKIVVSWTAVTGATYILFRSEGDDSNAATQLATVASGTTYEDFDIVVGTVYRYWVKATTGTQTSGFSSSDTGYASATGGAGAGSFTRSTNTDSSGYINWTVPEDIEFLTSVKLWAGGGGGGGGGRPSFAPAGSVTYYSGGGGGGGGYRELLNVAVTAGEILKVYVGRKGSGGAATSDSGSVGKATSLRRSSTVLGQVEGGKGGGGGGDNVAGGAGGAGGSGNGGTNGNAGAAGGTSVAGGAGGTPGVDGSGSGIGGAGGGDGTAGAAGTDGRIEIRW